MIVLSVSLVPLSSSPRNDRVPVGGGVLSTMTAMLLLYVIDLFPALSVTFDRNSYLPSASSFWLSVVVTQLFPPSLLTS